MSILIKGAKMSEGCDGCICSYEDDEVLMCPLLGESVDYFVETGEGRHPLCPLVEIPPYSKLIDANMVYQELLPYSNSFRKSVLKVIENIPTVIESEEE